LVITGTEDVDVPVANSLIIAAKIPGSWLVQIKGAGHGLMQQYPDKFSRVLQTFLGITTSSVIQRIALQLTPCAIFCSYKH
jgi:pimeloyl-ACP methyl ester carboxylesterase